MLLTGKLIHISSLDVVASRARKFIAFAQELIVSSFSSYCVMVLVSDEVIVFDEVMGM